MIRKILKWSGIIIGTVLLLALISYSFVSYRISGRMNKHYQFAAEQIPIPADSVSIAHGRHLTLIKGCTECHGDNMAGGLMADDFPLGRLAAPNLTRGAGGIGARYGTQDWLRTLRHGVAPDGRPLLLMPSHEFTVLSQTDLADIVAYCRQLPAVDQTMPSTKVGPVIRVMAYLDKLPLLPVEKINHDAPIVKTADTTEGVALGKYLSISCSNCHRSDMKGGDPLAPGQPPVPNITASGEPGRWTKEEFFRTLRTGITPAGRQLKSENMPWTMTARYTDKELSSLYQYLHSLE
ncbi:MAG: cytochrome c [Williamsia sp.]|nr:cytochrome c [Williamsia sp.]